MPDVYLEGGGMVVCDADDIDLVNAHRWRTWEINGVTLVVKDLTAKGRRFRMHLHREVAFRMHPNQLRSPACMRVRPANGDYLDVRRENLEVHIKPRARGGARRPAGHKVADYRGTARASKQPPAWARGSGPSALHRNPAPGREADEDGRGGNAEGGGDHQHPGASADDPVRHGPARQAAEAEA